MKATRCSVTIPGNADATTSANARGSCDRYMGFYKRRFSWTRRVPNSQSQSDACTWLSLQYRVLPGEAL